MYLRKVFVCRSSNGQTPSIPPIVASETFRQRLPRSAADPRHRCFQRPAAISAVWTCIAKPATNRPASNQLRLDRMTNLRTTSADGGGPRVAQSLVPLGTAAIGTCAPPRPGVSSDLGPYPGPAGGVAPQDLSRAGTWPSGPSILEGSTGLTWTLKFPSTGWRSGWRASLSATRGGNRRLAGAAGARMGSGGRAGVPRAAGPDAGDGCSRCVPCPRPTGCCECKSQLEVAAVPEWIADTVRPA